MNPILLKNKNNTFFAKFENKSWPHLVGKPVDEAVAEIQRENPSFQVQKIAKNSPVTLDLRSDRVRVFFGDDGKVSQPPSTG